MALAKWDVNRLPAVRGMTTNDYILLLIKIKNGNRRNTDKV